VFGRWKADSLFTRAGALEPDNPEPFYYLGLVGIALRGDDGEWVARRGLTHVLEIDPQYRDVWSRWLSLYRGPEERRAAVAALARHAGEPVPDLWRSRLLVELESYAGARSILEALIARSPGDPAPHALLAQLLYEMGNDSTAAPVYEAALARADADTGGLLWHQVRSTASPGERETYGRTPPDGRTAFFHVFWAHRRPDIRAPLNGRIGEHFRRLREARRAFALQHPNSIFFHSPVSRSIPRTGARVSDCLRGAIGTGFRVALPPAPTAAPANPEETMNLEDGLDDRGRIFVRYGAPDEWIACGVGSETWRYRLPEGVLQVTFARRTGQDSASGDALVTPIVAGEWESARWLLATDRPSGPTTLPFAYWSAMFRGADRWQTELFLIPDSASTVAALTDALGRDVVLGSATAGPLRLAAPPGRYLLALDAARGDSVGRVRGAITLPPFTGESLAVSSLLITDRDTTPERLAMAAAAPGGLRLRREGPLRLYAEVYGLAVEDGRSRYDAAYRFERAGGRAGRPAAAEQITTVRFRRDQPARSVSIEFLVIDPGRLAPGRYRLQLWVRDAIARRRAASTSLEFELR
jgi:hypothetical protein